MASIRSEKGIVTLLARWRVVNGFVDYSACQQRGIARNKAAQDRQWIARSFGLWLSLVERLPRVQEAVGSNPTSPMNVGAIDAHLGIWVRINLYEQSA